MTHASGTSDASARDREEPSIPALSASPDVAESFGNVRHDLPRIDGYQVTGLLGQGGMGTVWRAVETCTRRPVALKLLGGAAFRSPRARARFEREIALSARLEHPHIARIYHSGLHEGVYFYAMQLVVGLHLDESVRHDPDPRRTLTLVASVCDAIAYAHEREIVHRDLKPSNVLVTSSGQPFVLDFGLARALSSDEPATLTVDGGPAGTLSYMAPEQAAGRLDRVDQRSDVYSLGVILFRLLLGRFPHDSTGGPLAVQQRIIEGHIASPARVDPHVDVDLAAVLLKALARDPCDRYPDAGALGDDLRRFLAGDAIHARAPTLLRKCRRRLSRHRRGVITAAATLIVLAALVLAFAARSSAARQRAERDQTTARHVTFAMHLTMARSNLVRRDLPAARAHLDRCPPNLRHWAWHRLDLTVRHLGLEGRRGAPGIRTFRAGDHAAVRLVRLAPSQTDEALVAATVDERGVIGLRDLASHSETVIRADHGPVADLAFGNHGRHLASLSRGRLTLRDARDGATLVVLAVPNDTASLAFAGLDDWVAAATPHGLTIFESMSGEEGLILNAAAPLAHARTAGLLASIDPRRTGQVMIIDTTDWQEAARIVGGAHPGRIVLSDDGRRLAACHGDAVTIWCVQSAAVLSRFRPYAGEPPDDLAFSRDGARLLTAGPSLRIWDAYSGEELMELGGDRSGRYFSATFSPDDRRIVASSTGRITVWETRNAEH
ncbi:MAG: hypothetical protein CMJ18_05015 [Phycisphaeraceae bacterium]|nr:hypothetical protein [Phycisphaeraceae bacterium]